MNKPDKASPVPSAPVSPVPYVSPFAARAAKIEALFNAILAALPEHREALLAEAEADDPSLPGEVRELVAAHEQAGDFLAESSLPPISAELETEMAAFKSEKEGDLIGRHKLLQQIGVGGFGTVWMAEQTEPMVRKVALKIVQSGMNSKEVIGRFEQERQVLALMDHPNIAKVFDAGATPNGLPYFAMELVKGLPINKFCDESGLGTRERLALFLDVCSAIQHAHQKGIIHRDIKPSNVMVTLHGEKPVVKVIDFGIAKATHGKLTDKTLFTRFEQFIGTPVYMSPEQAALSGLDIDTRSDIYALGILLYELLTGKPPFDSQTLASAGYDEMRRVIREVEPPKPSSRLSTIAGEERTLLARSRRIQPERIKNIVEPDLDWIVMKAIDKDRARRYETAAAFAADVRCFLDDQAVTARPPSWSYRAQKTFLRHKFGFIAAGAMIFVLVVGGVVSSVQASRAKRATQVAHIEAARSALVAQFIKDMLYGAAPSVALGRDTTLLREILDQTSQRLDELQGQPNVEADLRETVGEVYFGLGKYTEAGKMLKEAVALREGSGADGVFELSAALLSHAAVLSEQGELVEAEKLIRRSLDMLENAVGAERLPIAAGIHALAEIKRKQGSWSEAEELFRESLSIRRIERGEDALAVASSWSGLGRVLRARGKMKEAETASRQALGIWRKLRETDNLFVASELMNLGRILLSTESSAIDRKERVAEAEKFLREAVDTRRRLLGAEHPETIEALDFLFDGLSLAQKDAQAEQVAREALALRRKLKDGTDADLISALLRVAKAAEAQGKQSELREFLAEATLLQGKANASPLGRALILEQTGDLLRTQKKLVEAEAAYRSALELRSKALDPTHTLVIRLGFSIARVLSDQGRRADAEQSYRELFAAPQKPLSDLEAPFVTPLFDFAKLLDRNGKQMEAAEVYRACIVQRQKIFGDETGSAAGPLLELGSLLQRQGKLAEAEVAARESLRLGRAEIDGKTDTLRRALHQLSGILLEQGELVEAEALAREDLALRGATGSGGAGLWRARRHLASIFIAAKKISEAEPLLSAVCRDFGDFSAEISEGDRRRLKHSLDLLIRAYEEVGHVADAGRWKTTLADLKL